MLQTLVRLREEHRQNPEDPATMVMLAEALADYAVWCQDQVEAVTDEARALVAHLRSLPVSKQEAAILEADRRGLLGPDSSITRLKDG